MRSDKFTWNGFLLISILHLIGHLMGWAEVTNITKPLLMPILLTYYLQKMPKKEGSVLKKADTFILAALVCSFFGDILLMKAPSNDLFFIFGLFAFLLAHISYILSFLTKLKKANVSMEPGIVIFMSSIFYLIVMVFFLYPHLEKGLKIPVMLYACVITSMMITSTTLKPIKDKLSFQLLITGAALFVISDSLIAVNKFILDIPLAGFWIMLTYISAQGLLVRSMISVESIENQN